MNIQISINLGPDDSLITKTPDEIATGAFALVGGDPGKDSCSVVVTASASVMPQLARERANEAATQVIPPPASAPPPVPPPTQ